MELPKAKKHFVDLLPSAGSLKRIGAGLLMAVVGAVASPGQAALPQATEPTKLSSPKEPAKLVMQPSTAPTQLRAQHYSHYSHRSHYSHQSHQSHYSSRY